MTTWYNQLSKDAIHRNDNIPSTSPLFALIYSRLIFPSFLYIYTNVLEYRFHIFEVSNRIWFTRMVQV